MDAVALLQAAGTDPGQIASIASTFGVDWPHLIAQTISFGIVCAVLYAMAYTPILRMLEARREQIAAGIAGAERVRAELARVEGERRSILVNAEVEAERMIDEARAAAAQVRSDEIRNAMIAAEEILTSAREAADRERDRMVAEAKRDVVHLVAQTTAAVTGKILTAEDHRRLVEETRRVWR
jgi:F-type H+-transporting ATPase subunit b